MDNNRQIYSLEDVKAKTLEYFKGDALATDVWINKYALKDSAGNIYELTPDDMHHRIAKEIARIESKYPNPLSEEEIYDVIKDFKYIIPQGGPMAGIGNDLQISSLSNCFVIGTDGPADSYGAIMKIDQEQVQLMKRRGGVGHDLSKIRPAGSPVKNCALTSTGVVPFMERYSNSTKEVAQDGRRGALMLSISIEHPDVESFIDAKLTEGKITNANISVRITDEFMNAVINNTTFTQRYPVGSDNPTVIREINARGLWNKIIHNAWKSAEPGILFWDTIIRESIPDCYRDKGFETLSTNPCITGNMKVYTNEGYKRIDEIVERFNNGDRSIEILTYSIETGTVIFKKLLNAAKTRIDTDVIDVRLVSGKTISMTPDHMVYTTNKGYIKADELTGEDSLLVLGDVTHSNVYNARFDKIAGRFKSDVYDITVEENHNFFVESLLVHNCGEIPLCAYDSCRLLALNLYSYVKKPFTCRAEFDENLFVKHVMIAQRMMDDIIDLELEKIDAIKEKILSDPESMSIKEIELNLWDEIKKKAIMGRRTGIGITAEGDMLAALGMRYADDNIYTKNIQRVLAHNAYKSSVNLAKERGSFEIYNADAEKDNPFIQRLKDIDPSLYEDMVKYGRRNISMLTIAPTGTVSICTQTTSGIEPVFLVNYKRRRKINPNDKSNKPTITDKEGNMFEEYNVFHHKFLIWAEINGISKEQLENMSDDELNEIIMKSPYYKSTSNDINWVDKVEMQGMMQKWVDHSISVTVNVPAETTEETVNDIYMTAWKSGCKGVTIYRDGSRTGILVSNNKKENSSFHDNDSPVRPKEIECDVIRFQNNYEKWVAFVGKVDNKPYEIFTGRLEDFPVPNYVDKGWIYKQRSNDEEKTSHYNFRYIDKDNNEVIMPDLSKSFNKVYWNYAKLISAVLRHGMPLNYVVNIVQTLSTEEDSINTWKNGVARCLKRYIPNGTKAGKEKCPDCGSDLIYEDGCMHCKDCGYSRCG